MWGSWLNGFSAFLKLEKSLSHNSIEAYCRDVKKLDSFLEIHNIKITPLQVNPQHIKECLVYLNQVQLNEKSQARFISAIRTFFSISFFIFLFVLEDKAVDHHMDSLQ
jgi:integrase/recombinase XerD